MKRMDVSVLETRQNRLAVELDDAGEWAAQAGDVGGGAEGGDPAARNGEGFSGRPLSSAFGSRRR